MTNRPGDMGTVSSENMLGFLFALSVMFSIRGPSSHHWQVSAQATLVDLLHKSHTDKNLTS